MFNRIFFWLTNCLMPSDSRSSTIAKDMGLIFSLFGIASPRKVPFAITLYMQCILHGLTSVLLCVLFIFSHHKKCRFCGRHVMASIRNENGGFGAHLGLSAAGKKFYSYCLSHPAVKPGTYMYIVCNQDTAEKQLHS